MKEQLNEFKTGLEDLKKEAFSLFNVKPSEESIEKTVTKQVFNITTKQPEADLKPVESEISKPLVLNTTEVPNVTPSIDIKNEEKSPIDVTSLSSVPTKPSPPVISIPSVTTEPVKPEPIKPIISEPVEKTMERPKVAPKQPMATTPSKPVTPVAPIKLETYERVTAQPEIKVETEGLPVKAIPVADAEINVDPETVKKAQQSVLKSFQSVLSATNSTPYIAPTITEVPLSSTL